MFKKHKKKFPIHIAATQNYVEKYFSTHHVKRSKSGRPRKINAIVEKSNVPKLPLQSSTETNLETETSPSNISSFHKLSPKMTES